LSALADLIVDLIVHWAAGAQPAGCGRGSRRSALHGSRAWRFPVGTDWEVADDHAPDTSPVGVVISAGGPLSRHAYFLHWGVVQISLTNFIIIVLMLVIFALALVLPFPHGRNEVQQEDRDEH
jgi:hypothetical protein